MKICITLLLHVLLLHQFPNLLLADCVPNTESADGLPTYP